MSTHETCLEELLHARAVRAVGLGEDHHATRRLGDLVLGVDEEEKNGRRGDDGVRIMLVAAAKGEKRETARKVTRIGKEGALWQRAERSERDKQLLRACAPRPDNPHAITTMRVSYVASQ